MPETCPECRGEGKVATVREKVFGGALQALSRIGTVATTLAIAPLVTSMFYGFARFLAWLTEVPIMEKDWKGNPSMAFYAAMLVSLGAIAGLAATVTVAISLLEDKKS